MNTCHLFVCVCMHSYTYIFMCLYFVLSTINEFVYMRLSLSLSPALSLTWSHIHSLIHFLFFSFFFLFVTFASVNARVYERVCVCGYIKTHTYLATNILTLLSSNNNSTRIGLFVCLCVSVQYIKSELNKVVWLVEWSFFFFYPVDCSYFFCFFFRFLSQVSSLT